MVNQFRNNKYQEQFYLVDRESANVLYDLNFLIPELFNKISDYEQLKMQNQNSLEGNVEFKISGYDLLGVINKQSKKLNKV
jgi:hypothetical protein